MVISRDKNNQTQLKQEYANIIVERCSKIERPDFIYEWQSTMNFTHSL